MDTEIACSEGRQCEDTGRKPSVSQRMLENTRSEEGGLEQILPAALRRISYATDTLKSDFQPPELSENKLLLFEPPNCGILLWRPLGNKYRYVFWAAVYTLTCLLATESSLAVNRPQKLCPDCPSVQPPDLVLDHLTLPSTYGEFLFKSARPKQLGGQICCKNSQIASQSQTNSILTFAPCEGSSGPNIQARIKGWLYFIFMQENLAK